MKQILSIIGLILSLSVSSQEFYETYFSSDDDNSAMMQVPGISSSDTLKSMHGNSFSTKGTYRALTIAVNIIYDQTPTLNPYPYNNGVWDYTTSEGININPPTYLLNFFDVNNVTPYNGCVTRLYAESSFDQLILLSDYMVVNIMQSRITPNNAGNDFSKYDLMNSVINYINQNGGLNSLYNHVTLPDFDFSTSGTKGVKKQYLPDGKIDIINFLLRNTTVFHGEAKVGQGFSDEVPDVTLKINQDYCGYNTGTYQCVGNRDITTWKKNIFTHEYAHFFLGDNAFHTSGSVTTNDQYKSTFMGIQKGYGLFSGGLLSCNGYERWRLGWYGSTNNSFPIAANNENSDILSKFTGERTFILRDFVTYGDVIRIKLPYKDSELASNQYIWLENHQCGINGKFDIPIYHQSGSCRDVAQPGIYSYYQVGKDILEYTGQNAALTIFPSNEKDNLRIISAEGNYNMSYLGRIQDCLNYAPSNNLRPVYEYLSPNPFQGSNDQTHVFPVDLTLPNINYVESNQFVGSKVCNGIPIKNLPYLGDNLDAFIPTLNGKLFDISSNPSAINTLTYYTIQNLSVNNYSKTDNNRDTRKLYLTGLSIKMIDPDPAYTGMKAYTVKIRWDDYDVKQDVNWTGDIVLKEQLNLLSGKKIVLEQNLTPGQINRDPVSGVFAPTTVFTCESNSVLSMESGSAIQLKDKSSFVIKDNSIMTLQDNAIINVESGSTLQIKSGANLNIQGGGKILVKSGGYLCVETGANINLQDYKSLIILEEGASYGANPLLFTSPSCVGSIVSNGNGTLVDFNQDMYIQNQTFGANKYIGGKNIFVGNHVDLNKETGDVIINNGANVIFDGKTVTFDKGFECVSGSTYEVKNH
jgi:hypothetical protein